MIGVLLLAAALVPTSSGSSGPAYPPPPAAPRIVYSHSLADNAAYQPRPTWWRRLLHLVAGSREPESLVRPWGLEAGEDALWVCDPGAGVVHGFRHADSTYVRIPRTGRLDSPIDLARDGSGRIHVTDSERGTVSIWSAAGEPRGEHAGGFERPTGVAWHPAADRVYVVDTLRHCVAVQSPAGERLFTFGRRGEGEGELNFPTAITVGADGGLYVTDSMNFRIQTFDPDGGYLGMFGRPGDGSGDFSKPKGVAVDGDGHVYVVDALFEVVQIFDPDGTLLLAFGRPGTGAGEFSLPTGIAIDGSDRVYVADSFNRRVQVFRYLGAGEGSQ